MAPALACLPTSKLVLRPEAEHDNSENVYKDGRSVVYYIDHPDHTASDCAQRGRRNHVQYILYKEAKLRNAPTIQLDKKSEILR